MTASRRGGVEDQGFLAAIVECSQDAIVGGSLDETIVTWNGGAERLYGYTAKQAIGRPLSVLESPSAAGELSRILERIGEGEEVARFETTHARADGTPVNVSVAVSPIVDASGRAVGASVIACDIGERAPVEAMVRSVRASERIAQQAVASQQDFELKLVETQKLEALGVLAGGIAHDFNNLLGVILGNTSLALQTLPAESPLYPWLEQVEVAARRSAELAKQMLAYSGKGMFVVQPVGLSELVRGIAELIQGTISKKAVLSWAFAPDTPTIEGDVAQLHQVVLNLITNASEALGDEPGTIEISTGAVEADRSLLSGYELADELPPGRYAFFEVADSGPGMDAETQARIFEPFFSTKFVGRGLGLAAVQGIVRGHSGAIKLTSEPGRGTSFRLLFPAVSAQAETTVPEAVDGLDWRGSGTVVVADDDDGLRLMATAMLEELGFAVIPARDGPEALKIVNERDGELAFVLLDLMMPGMDGEQVLRELEQLQTTTPIVISSGYNTQHLSQELTGRGVAAFLQKPYEFSQLQALARSVIGSRARP